MSFACMSARLNFVPRFGVAHDMWNSVKNAARHSAGGVLWRCLLKLSAVAIVPFGPFRSGSWRYKLREALSELQCRLVSDHPRFLNACEQQHFWMPHLHLGVLRPELFWSDFGSLPMCVEGGSCTILKFARWFSISTVWAELAPQWWFLRLVFEQARDAEDTGDVLVQNSSTDQWDQPTPSKGGLFVARLGLSVRGDIRAYDDLYNRHGASGTSVQRPGEPADQPREPHFAVACGST